MTPLDIPPEVETFSDFLKATGLSAEQGRHKLEMNGFVSEQEGYAKGDHLIKWQRKPKPAPRQAQACSKADIRKPKKGSKSNG